MPRALEVLMAGCLLAILLPPAAVAALLVRLSLGRPVFFRQVRSGQGGRQITLRKLRTMRDDRGADGQPLPDEDRLTSLGRVLRRYRLDEVPQLLAVLKGDLSLVGPRPLLPSTLAGFGEASVLRGRVKPGITGWAQVNGNTQLGDDEKLSLDLWYVDHRSTALDLAILWLTVVTVLLGESRAEARIRSASSWRAARESGTGLSLDPVSQGLR